MTHGLARDERHAAGQSVAPLEKFTVPLGAVLPETTALSVALPAAVLVTVSDGRGDRPAR